MLTKIKKLTASILAIIIVVAQFSIIGININTTYAASDLENQKIKTNNNDIEFDTYFKNDTEKSHSAIMDIGKSANIYLNINVKGKGYLKDSKVQLVSEDGGISNMQVQEVDEQILTEEEIEIYDKYLQEINSKDNSIIINQINKVNNIELKIPFIFNSKENVSIQDFEKINIAKFSAIYVNEKGDEKKVESEIKFELKWSSSPEMLLEQSISKAIPYDINEEKGVMLETVIKSGLIGNVLPIEKTNIQIDVPKIDGITIDEVLVTAKSTIATNGDEKGYSFNEENWKYDSETGKIEITTTNNVNENNELVWKREGNDEYIVTYILKSLNNEQIDMTTIESSIKVTGTINVINNIASEIKAEIETPLTITETTGDMVTLGITTSGEISKGLIYSNYKKNEGKLETEYDVSYSVDIGYANLTDRIILTQETDKFSDINNKITDSNVSGENFIYNKEIRVSKEGFDKILGDQGSISIMQNGLALATIDNVSVPNENGELILNIANFNLNNIEIYISKPIDNGKLDINVKKAIKAESTYTIEEMKSFDKILTRAKIQSIYNENIIAEETLEGITTLKEPVSKAEILISTDRLSTILKNENVEIRAILNTNSMDDALYTNPTIDIVLPEYIEDINIKDAKLMFEDELVPVSAEKIVENGKTVIRVLLQGTQTKYNLDATARGTNISLIADITARKLTPNKEEQIQMFYTNENTSVYENTAEDGRGIATADVKFVSPGGVVAVNSLYNYTSDEEQKIEVISGETYVATLETNEDGYTATTGINVINNYEESIKNIKILGRTYGIGNTNVSTGEDLETNIDMNMVKAIEANNAVIYYSQNARATEDLENAENGWTTTINDISKIRSYLIIVNEDIVLNAGDNLSFTYDMQIPEKLTYNKSASGMYEVLYDKILEEGDISERVISPIINLTTGEGPEIEASINANIENGTEVKENDIIEFNVTIKNIGKIDIKDAAVTVVFPYGITHVRQTLYTATGEPFYTEELTKNYREKIDIIKTGETKTFKCFGRIDELDIADICKDESHYSNGKHNDQYKHNYEDYTRNIVINTSVESDKLGTVDLNELQFTVKKQYALIELSAKPGSATVVGNKQTILYEANVKNEQLEELKDVMVKANIPEGTEYSQAYVGDRFNVEGIELNNNQVTWNLGTMQSEEEKTVSLEVTANITGEKTEIKNAFNLSAQDKSEITSNEVKNVILSDVITVSQACNITDKNIYQGDLVSYTLTIDNYGYDGNITIEKEIPDGLEISKVTINKNGKSMDGSILDQKLYSTTISTKVNDKIIIVVECIANIGAETSKEVSSVFTVKYDDKELQTNTITHTIVRESNNGNSGEDGSGQNGNTYRISGLAWLDADRNGERSDTEEPLDGIQARLINKSNNNVEQETQTANDGSYSFSGVPNGEYYIMYIYDTTTYSVTSYKADGVIEERNNDATYVDTALDGEASKVGMTDSIVINNRNVYNIDIGLVRNRVFDLKLDKYVSKITVRNNTGTDTHDYENTKLAKKELIGKHLNSTSLVIEYTLIITNEGDVPGYVKKLVDYLPDELQFSSELNQDWYLGDDNNIYNSSLANEVINPGESREVGLTLTKKMTEENLGLINNKAEIAESYNDLGIDDIDSVAGNNAQGEDDISSADVLLSVKTGGVILYTGVVIFILALMGIAIYFMYIKIVKKKI